MKNVCLGGTRTKTAAAAAKDQRIMEIIRLLVRLTQALLDNTITIHDSRALTAAEFKMINDLPI